MDSAIRATRGGIEPFQSCFGRPRLKISRSTGRVEPISQNALKFYERIAYDDDFGGMAMDDNETETDRICALLQDKPVLLMGNHGVTVVGNTVSEAFDRLYFLEKTCESQVLAMSTGRPLKYVDEATARRTRDQWENYPGLQDNQVIVIMNYGMIRWMREDYGEVSREAIRNGRDGVMYGVG